MRDIICSISCLPRHPRNDASSGITNIREDREQREFRTERLTGSWIQIVFPKSHSAIVFCPLFDRRDSRRPQVIREQLLARGFPMASDVMRVNGPCFPEQCPHPLADVVFRLCQTSGTPVF